MVGAVIVRLGRVIDLFW